MIVQTAISQAFAKSLETTDPNGLGIEHRIKHAVQEPRLTQRKVPDVFIKTTRYHGEYVPPVDKPEVDKPEVEEDK